MVKPISFLNKVDVLVDGKFIIEEKSLNLKFRGSRNQRIIDVAKSIKRGEVVIIKTLMMEEVNNTVKKIEEELFI